MSMLDIHKDAIESHLSLFHEFLSHYNKMAKKVYGFVEGREDYSFYRGALEHYLPSDWNVELRHVGNKKKVIQLYSEFDWTRFSRIQIIFFMDRDLSDFLNESLPSEPNIFITEKYSIENDIVNRNTCDRVLSEICKLDNISRNERDNILDLFDKQLDRFQEKMVSIMSWVIYWKRCGYRPCLDNIDMKHLFKFHQGRLLSISKPRGCKSQIEYIHNQCRIDCKPAKGIRRITDEFRKSKGDKRFIRGKYLLWFLVEYISSIHSNADSFSKKLASPPKMNLSLSHSNAIVVIAPRSRIPNSLAKFIQTTCLKYVRCTSEA